MSKPTRVQKTFPLRKAEPDWRAPCAGQISRIDEEGVAWVDFPENPEREPVRARSLLDAPGPLGSDPERLVGAEVLLTFEGSDPALPIVMGIIRSTLRPRQRPPEVALTTEGVKDVLVDGRRLVFEAEQEIVLRCGKSTIVLTRDGRMLLRGEHLTSHATSTNKIKGGSVSLN